MSPLVLIVNQRRHFHDPLAKLGGDEGQAFGVAHHHVARHHGGTADADRHIDAHECDIVEGRGINALYKDAKSFDQLDTGLIAHRALHHQAVVGMGENGGAQIVAGIGAILDFPEQVDHHDVARHKPIAHHAVAAIIDNAPPAFELVVVTVLLQHGPRLFRVHGLHLVEQRIGNLRPAVLKSIAGPGAGQINALFFGKHSQLCVTRQCHAEGEHQEGNVQHHSFHYFLPKKQNYLGWSL